jgi:PEGA domain
MSRVKLIVAATAAVMVIALGGCSGAMPEWMSTQPPGPQMQSLRFESDPPGADVRTAKGQSCETPCALAVPGENQAVSFAKPGFEPQTVQVIARESTDQSYFSSMFGNPPPRILAPNPVQVVMISEPPPPPPKSKHHKSVSRARTARTTPPPAPPTIAPKQPMAQPASAPFPPPDPQPASSPFPPPPQQQAPSPFPPPPPTH